MKISNYILLLVFGTFTMGCKISAGNAKPKPDWVKNRPVNTNYYIGIGVASKQDPSAQYQSVAKKNALNDLVSEIKVVVSANSVLTQLQQNTEFKQTFESETRLSALQTIDNFEHIGSWEDKENYWVYYRLSKEEFAAARRRKIQLATDRATDYYEQSLSMRAPNQYTESVRYKILSLYTLQEFLGEDIPFVGNGKQTYFVNEVYTSLQNQLSELSVNCKLTDSVTSGTKADDNYLQAYFLSKTIQGEAFKIPNLPVKVIVGQQNNGTTLNGITDQNGLARFDISRIRSKGEIQTFRVSMNIQQLLLHDSMKLPLKQVLLSLDVPENTVSRKTTPITIYVQSSEQNIQKPMQDGILESALKNKLAENGFEILAGPEQATITIKIVAATKSLGAIYKTMQGVSLDFSVSVLQNNNNSELYKIAVSDTKGYQTTAEGAGLEAYKTASTKITQEIYPQMERYLTGF